MAESLLFSFAESFIGKLASLAVQEASLALGVVNDLQEMKDTVLIIKGVLLDAEQKQHQNHAMREWLRQIKRVFNDAEDLMDDFECEALQKQLVKTSGSFQRKVRRFFSVSSNPLVYRLRMAHEIKDIRKRLDKVAADRLKFGLQINESDNRTVVQRRETHSRVDDLYVIGREHDKKRIIDLLLKDHDDANTSLSVVPIVGMGGLGKTTLAKSVFNDENIVESFPLRMWVCISNDFDLKRILIKILNAAGVEQLQNQETFSVEQLQNHLTNKLTGKKFLLVLDDVWNEDRVKWAELRGLIKIGDTPGCTILVTTRSLRVANMMATQSPHILQGLSEKDSLSVFVKWAFKEGGEKNYPELVEIGKDIVQKCGGLPLALRTLGSSLFLKVDIQEWIFVRDSDIWSLPQNEDDILPAIKLSFDQLPSYLKPCFACFSLFDKDFAFCDSIVVKIWEGLGFLPSPKKGQTTQDVGNQLILELHARSLLQDIDVEGGISFKLHDLVHDFALYLAGDEFQIINPDTKNISENVLHLTFSEYYLLGQIPIPNYLTLRTILFPLKADNVVFLNTLMTRCKHLRVLEITNSMYERLPYSIGKLKHLRYLGLGYNEKLNSLPDSLCQLQNLRSLSLQGCTNLQTLPSGIGNLVNLRVLLLTTKQSKFPNEEIAKLTSLEMLGISYCDNLESLFEGIQLIPSLNYLLLNSCRKLKSVSLSAIPNLETLLINKCELLNLSMVGHHNQVPKLNLKSLMLGSLPQLVTFPDEWCMNTLQTLVIQDCENLEELPKWLTNVTCLKNIEITDCEKLISLPDGVHRLPNLESIEIRGCPNYVEDTSWVGSRKD